MKINKKLTQEEVRLLEGLGVVLEQECDPYFRKKEPVVPPGMRRLSSGRIVPYTSIKDCLKW